MTYAAVVVSYNRSALLRKCLTALSHQTQPLDEIIVIDNGSTDDSVQIVRSEFPDSFIFETKKNLGGAGGFAWGVEIAIARGHQAAWLMDDDAEPELDAFAELITAYEGYTPLPAIAASLVTSKRDRANLRNPPIFANQLTTQLQAQEHGNIAITGATFVGVLVNLNIARNTYLPLMDLFIWGDDTEYTQRLTAQHTGIFVTKSQINHPDATGNDDLGPRLYYLLRNHMWVKTNKSNNILAPIAGAVESSMLALHFFSPSHDKKVWLKATTTGIFTGLFKRAHRQQVGSLLSTLTPSERIRILQR